MTPALPTKPIFGRRTNRPKMMMNDHDMMMMTMMDHLSFNEKVSLSYFWAISTIPRCAMHLWCIVSWSWVQYIFGVVSLVLCIVSYIAQACNRSGASTLLFMYLYYNRFIFKLDPLNFSGWPDAPRSRSCERGWQWSLWERAAKGGAGISRACKRISALRL